MLQKYYIIKTYIPVDLAVNTGWPISKQHIVEMSSSLREIIILLQDSDPVGRVGNYQAVYEIGLGLEGFTPGVGSNPTLTQNNDHEETPSVSFTTYVSCDVSEVTISNFVQCLSTIHPWEHPIIEIFDSKLWVPN